MREWLNRTHVGDCRELLRAMADGGARVQTCVTSPPYFGLRDYGVEGQIGLENSPAEYVERTVEVFRAVRDVLADDGTVGVNLGDSYTGNGGQSPQTGPLFKGRRRQRENICLHLRGKGEGFKPKDLMGIPWRVALAVQTDGWYLRSDIIWHKPNPMPESVTDHPTKAHEYLFLLSKSEHYYYDAEAIREPDSGLDHPRNLLDLREPTGGLMSPHRGIRSAEGRNSKGRNKRSVWTIAPRIERGEWTEENERQYASKTPESYRGWWRFSNLPDKYDPEEFFDKAVWERNLPLECVAEKLQEETFDEWRDDEWEVTTYDRDGVDEIIRFWRSEKDAGESYYGDENEGGNGA